MKTATSTQAPTTTTPPPQSNEGSWKRDLAVAGVTVAAAAGGTYLGAEIGAHMLVDHVAQATQGHGLFAILTVPVEVLRGMITHVAPWAVGTGTVTGMLGYAAGTHAMKGAPLTDETTTPTE